tara:strand:- start:578 stop:952 length:375 start_codon:yes stop_codon:yes gene_type:complete
MLTLKQQTQVLKFLLHYTTATLKQAVIENKKYCDNSVRIYDSACLANVYTQLANTYSTDDDNVLSYTFTADCVKDSLAMLDTEYRETVAEMLMQYNDNLSVAIYGKTYKQHCENIEKRFAQLTS